MKIFLTALTVAALAACATDKDDPTFQAGDGDTAADLTLPDETTPATSAISLNDFTIDLVVLESQCYDTAGALVTVEPDVSVPGGSYPGRATLVYEIRGGEAVETFRMDLDGSDYTYQEHTISTASCNYHLVATPVRLIERP